MPRRAPTTLPPRLALLVLFLVAGPLLAGACRSPSGPGEEAAAPRTPVSAPGRLEAAVVRHDGIALRWEPVPGATGYRVYRDGAPIGRAAEPLFLDLGGDLVRSASREYAVAAVGAGEIESERSEPVRTPTEMPRDAVPRPVFDERPDLVDLYYAAWADAWSRVVAGDAARGFPFPHFAPAGEVRVTDAWLSVELARHAYPLLPIEGLLDAFHFHAARAGTDEPVETLPLPVPAAPATAPPPPSAPGALASAEWRLFTAKGDLERLRRVRGSLESRFARARDLERGRVAYASELAIAADALAKIALALGDESGHRAWSAARAEIRDRVNARHWDETAQIYRDLAADGSFVEAATLDSFHPLAAGIPDRTRAAALVYHLEDRAGFKRAHRFPGVAASDPRYRADGGRGPEEGAVDEYRNALLSRGLAAYGFEDLARAVALEHLGRVAAVRAGTGRFFDGYAPDVAAPSPGAREGIAAAPVAALLSRLCGVEADAAAGTLRFRVGSLERHGAERLRVGPRVVSIVCLARRSETDACDVEVETDGPIALLVSTPWAEFPIPRVEAGRSRFRLMRPPGSSP